MRKFVVGDRIRKGKGGPRAVVTGYDDYEVGYARINETGRHVAIADDQWEIDEPPEHEHFATLAWTRALAGRLVEACSVSREKATGHVLGTIEREAPTEPAPQPTAGTTAMTYYRDGQLWQRTADGRDISGPSLDEYAKGAPLPPITFCGLPVYVDPNAPSVPVPVTLRPTQVAQPDDSAARYAAFRKAVTELVSMELPPGAELVFDRVHARTGAADVPPDFVAWVMLDGHELAALYSPVYDKPEHIEDRAFVLQRDVAKAFVQRAREAAER